jgi:hypothetical protein
VRSYQWTKFQPALAAVAIMAVSALAACGEFEDPPAFDAEDLAGGIPLKGEH